MSLLTRYALWLVPDDAGTLQLHTVIRQLADRYTTPVFTPHMTLLGWVKGEEAELVAQLETLAAKLAPIEARLTGFAGAPYYFRCFFAPIESSPELRQAVDEASHTFGANAGTDFKPHLSLLYGQLDREEKKTIPGQIGEKVPRKLLFNRLQLIRITVSVSGWETVAEAEIAG